MCPYCRSNHCIKFGTFSAFGRTVQRYRCRDCRRTFHEEYRSPQAADRKAAVNSALLKLLCSGVSQRRAALILEVRRATVARKISKYGAYFRQWHEQWLTQRNFGKCLLFDELETFEHTKCKPLSVAIAVEDRTRFILGTHVASMPAKGKLASIARKRYGLRIDERPMALQRLMDDMLAANALATRIKSDKAPRYPKLVRKNFPRAVHKTYKGRRGCVVGQGELKAGGYDPLFTLNHTYAMIRDNLKRLTRRTWATTKKPEQLQNLLNIYTVFHNRWLGAQVVLLLPGMPPTTMLGAS